MLLSAAPRVSAGRQRSRRPTRRCSWRATARSESVETRRVYRVERRRPLLPWVPKRTTIELQGDHEGSSGITADRGGARRIRMAQRRSRGIRPACIRRGIRPPASRLSRPPPSTTLAGARHVAQREEEDLRILFAECMRAIRILFSTSSRRRSRNDRSGRLGPF
jgi:hypothetical protein